ncbi:MAG TPA: bifunctional DNA-formamidopyrimidine glycosylase/DNA-(apurinic or apyrimidinic site) lyase [Oceanospirillales bacterium]|nr:bifunctional DNA-formamidopyrimidine glycosylase/DNA-(apurinic or apyrimidinic site) lyase [Oceanospirillales bacterium]
MPELPEVETTVNGIKPWLENKLIAKIAIHNPALRWQIPANLAQKYRTQKIVRIGRRAKYILLHLQSGATIIIHLGMSGSLTVLQEHEPLKKHDHFEMIMDDGTVLRFNDPRRFGCVLDAQDYSQHKLIIALGPEPLHDIFDGKYLKNKAKNKTQAVKNFIMDGKIVVGVGNIYASEALFRAKIHPNKAAGKVSLTQYKILATAIKEVLSKAIKAGGTTLKDFTNANGNPGYFAQELTVYGRKDQACDNCANPIKQMTIGQRSTFYCSNCQK